MRPSTRLTSVVFAIVTLLAVAGVIVTPGVASAARNCAFFDFAKGTNINSTLTWKYVDEYGRCILSHSYRAGSGVNIDPCDQNHGWLPDGWYDLKSTYHQNGYGGTYVKGRVWRLADKACQGNGTLRAELFIHTEETATRTQTCSSDADDPWCWDSTAAPGGGTGTNDYYSGGCIKVRRQSPEGTWADHMSDVHSDWHNLGGGSGHGVPRTDSVFVH